MHAKDLMIPLLEYLTPDHTIEETANLFKTAQRCGDRTGVRALPVLNEDGRLMGMLSIGDILKAVYPPYLYIMDLGGFTWDGMVETFAKQAAGKRVRDIMTKEVITVTEESTLMECVDHMLKNNVKRIPVLDDRQKVVGILYEEDVFHEITNAMLIRNGEVK